MIVHHEQVEVGVFVYQILQSDRVRVRSYPDILEDDEEEENQVKDPKRRGDFEVNELLAVDMIQPTSHATFLRLADQSGWVTADERGQVYMRQVFVETGLFSFYVDNLPHGIIVRRHPMDDSSDLLTTESGPRLVRLPPMQRIYCDALVQHPITGVKFYRLQCGGGRHATPGWVCEQKPAQKKGQVDKYYLLPANKVQTGLFCYKAVCGMFIRHRPICSDSSKTSSAVLPNDLVVVDVIRESPYDNGNGPFLRLADGSGWLFEKKLGERAMISIPIQSGHWVFAVMNDPVGMILRQQPMDCQDKVFPDGIYRTGELVECDRRIRDPRNGVHFYRVRGTAGWLFDSRNGVPMLNLVAEDTNVPVDANELDTVQCDVWEPHFVRGIVAIVPGGTKELYYQAAGQILTFENPDGIVVKVFCRTRSICSIFQHSSKGTIKFFRRDCTPQDVLEALKMDLIDTILAYDKFVSEKLPPALDGEEKKEDDRKTSLAAQVKDEETLRLRLLVCEAEILAAHVKRQELHASIQKYDDRRHKIALWMKESTERHRKAHEIAAPTNSKERNASERRPTVANTGSTGNGSKSIAKDSTKYRSVSSRSNFSSTRESDYDDTFDDEDGDESTDHRDQSRPRTVEASSFHAKMMQDIEEDGRNPKAFTCGECFRSFSGKYSRDIHCREVHKIYCARCDKIFPSFKDLEVHRDTFNHW